MRDPENMGVVEFVDAVEKELRRKEPWTFERICRMAKDGKMGFGTYQKSWGNSSGQG